MSAIFRYQYWTKCEFGLQRQWLSKTPRLRPKHWFQWQTRLSQSLYPSPTRGGQNSCILSNGLETVDIITSLAYLCRQVTRGNITATLFYLYQYRRQTVPGSDAELAWRHSGETGHPATGRRGVSGQVRDSVQRHWRAFPVPAGHSHWTGDGVQPGPAGRHHLAAHASRQHLIQSAG